MSERQIQLRCPDLTVLNESRGNRQPHYNPTTSSNVNQPGATRQLDVEVRGPIVHSVPVHKVATWLARGLNSPKEPILKQRLPPFLSFPFPSNKPSTSV